MKIDNRFEKKKVLILGLGLNEGGVGAARFFSKAGAKVRVTDIKSKEDLEQSLKALEEYKDIEYTLGEHKYEDIDWADIIIRNPALRPDNPYRQYAQKAGKRVELDMGILLDFIDSKKVIGVTGTKGKSTTTSLLYKILQEAQKKVVFAGNIGKSVLDVLDVIDEDHLLLLEISSFQLEAWQEHKVSPHWALITNIYPDHLNYHYDFEDYVRAKKVIADFQEDKDILFLRKDDPVTTSDDFKETILSQIKFFSKDDLPDGFKPELKGDHNLDNIAASVALAKALDVPEKIALSAAKEFKGIEFRLELIKQLGQLKIYNDSASTNPDSSIQALKALPNSILIAGGMNKNLVYKDYAYWIDRLATEVYFLEGSATEEIKFYLKDKEKMRSTYRDLRTLLQDLKKSEMGSKTVLFSPGATSFNLFDNEFDRGRKFNKAVKEVFE